MIYKHTIRCLKHIAKASELVAATRVSIVHVVLEGSALRLIERIAFKNGNIPNWHLNFFDMSISNTRSVSETFVRILWNRVSYRQIDTLQ